MSALHSRILFVATLVLSLGSALPEARAQFGGLDRFKKVIDKPVDALKQKVPEPVRKAAENAPDAARALKGAIDGIGPEEERLIGESVALEIIAKHGGVLRDEAITRRVNVVGRALAHYSSRPVLNWRFAVLDSPTVNGFSAPGGLVFITRGLYDLAAGSDDALAAILAHEIAHITQRHALKIIGRAELVAGSTNLLVRHNAQAADVQQQLSSFDTGIADIAKTLLEQGFDPKTELAADKHGRQLAVTVGYAPGALRQVLVQLQQRKGDANQVFTTHPPLATRIKNLPADPASAAASGAGP